MKSFKELIKKEKFLFSKDKDKNGKGFGRGKKAWRQVDPKWSKGLRIPGTFGQVLLKKKNVSIQVAYHTTLGKIKMWIVTSR